MTNARIAALHGLSVGPLPARPCPVPLRKAARFRLAIMASAAGIIIMHNHPSGESSPSDADIKITRDLIRGGQLIKIDVVDHIVIGNGNHTSLRELGYCAY